MCPVLSSPELPCPRRDSLVASLLRTYRQIRDEASPNLHRRVHFGWLANMIKALASPVRRAFYSANIVEAMAPYNLGWMEEGLKRRLSQLRRLVLFAEMTVPLRAE